jgi:hypothetical protein
MKPWQALVLAMMLVLVGCQPASVQGGKVDASLDKSVKADKADKTQVRRVFIQGSQPYNPDADYPMPVGWFDWEATSK